MARTILLWITGIIASGFAGAGIATLIQPYGNAEFWGWIAGLSAFVCIRLWWMETESRD